MHFPAPEGSNGAEGFLHALKDGNGHAITIEVVLVSCNWDEEDLFIVLSGYCDVSKVGEHGSRHSERAQHAEEGDELGPCLGGWGCCTPPAEEPSEVQEVEGLAMVDWPFGSVADQHLAKAADEWVVCGE